MKETNIFNEFGDMDKKQLTNQQKKQIVTTSMEREMNTVNALFKAIVTTVKDRWSKFMATIDDNLIKLKNRIDVTADPMKKNEIKEAYVKMLNVKKFDNPMKKVLMKSNAIYSKVRNADDPRIINQAKLELKKQREEQKVIIQNAKTVLDEARSILGANKKQQPKR